MKFLCHNGTQSDVFNPLDGRPVQIGPFSSATRDRKMRKNHLPVG